MAKSAPALPPPPATGEKQTIQARHGVATFVPQGHTLTIINTYGRQTVGLWGFALGDPPSREEWEADQRDDDDVDEEDTAGKRDENDENGELGDSSWVLSGEKPSSEEPSPEEGEEGPARERKEEKTGDARGSEHKEDEQIKPSESQSIDKPEANETGGRPAEAQEQSAPDTQSSDAAVQKDQQSARGWSAYLPSIPRRGKQPTQPKPSEKLANADENTRAASRGWASYIPSVPSSLQRSGMQQGKEKSNERNWSEYIPSGHAYSSYLPTKGTLSAIAAMHQRDPTKSVAEQLYDFSKTPVGAAGISVASGSGYASSIYAAYTAYSRSSSASPDSSHGMEFLSVIHTRTATNHISPQVGDTLFTNLRAPLLTLLDDTSADGHDTLLAACDPLEYRELGVKNWETHGSCAENLVLALAELNAQVGLKGRKAIGADITVNAVPAPLNLFLGARISDDRRSIAAASPQGSRGDRVRIRAERDVVVVMSACPQDITNINGKKPMVAHFVVESPNEDDRKASEVRENERKRILEKARRRTEEEKGLQNKAKSKSRISSGKVNEPPKEEAQNKSMPAAPDTRSTSQPSIAVTTRKSSSAQAPVSKRPTPRKLESRGSSRSGISQASLPRKEVQQQAEGTTEMNRDQPQQLNKATQKKKPRKIERRTPQPPRVQ